MNILTYLLFVCLFAGTASSQEDVPAENDVPEKVEAKDTQLVQPVVIEMAAAEPAVKQARKLVLIRFGSAERTLEISPRSQAFLERKLAEAKDLGADVVVIEIDSPGGYVDASLSLAETFRDLDWATTVAYVPRQALSGAAIMSLGCDEIIMNENARIGDAGPIFMGDDFLFRHAPEKVRSDLVRNVRDLSESSKRPPAIAEAMVDMDLEVFKVEHADNGTISYMSDAELRALDDPTEWRKGALLEPSKKGSFLEVNGKMALSIGLGNDVANSRTAVAARFGVEIEDVEVLEATWVDTVVGFLTFWPVTALLFVIGLIALYTELAAPGIGVGALVSGLCFSLFFWSRFLGGTAGWLEVLLFASGIVFLLMELFVIPGFGIAGIIGLVMLLASLLMATQRYGGADGININDLATASTWIVGAGVGSIIGMFVLSRFLGEVQLFKHLTLEPPAPVVATAGTLISSDRTEERPNLAIGDEGIADSPLRPAGRVLFNETYYDVVTDGSFVEKGSCVRVVKVSGTHVTVRQIS